MSEGSEPTRPSAITALAWLDLSCAAVTLAATAAATFLARTLEPSRATWVLGAGAAGVVMAVLLLAAGLGLLRLRPYGRLAQIAVALLAVPVVPFGTLFAAAVLIVLLKRGPRALFRGEAGADLTHDESGMLMAGALVGGASAAVIAAILSVAIAMPLVKQRRRETAEAAALAAVRTVMAAQTAYARNNGGRFDRMECLVDPAPCLAAGDTRPFLDAALLRETGDVYVFSFHPGPPPSWEDEEQGSSPSSMTAFAYVAAPRSDPAATRWFCADGTGQVCAVRRPEPPTPWNGHCPADCETVP